MRRSSFNKELATKAHSRSRLFGWINIKYDTCHLVRDSLVRTSIRDCLIHFQVKLPIIHLITGVPFG